MTTPRLERLATLVAGDPTVAAVVADRHDGLAALDVRGPVALRPFLTSALAGRGTVLVVTATGREADELVSDLGELVDPEAVVAFPAWETLPHERLSPRSDTVGRRLAVLRRLVHPEDGGTPVRVVVAPVRSVLQPQVKGLADLVPVTLRPGQDVVLDDVVAQFLQRVGWTAIPVLLLLATADILIVRNAMQPLLRASMEAAQISPNRLALRLSVDDVPSEILPLVTSINQALDRIEEGFTRQREFIADAAHELRTPLAVLRIRLETRTDLKASDELFRDVEIMSRVIGQLLDLAESDNAHLHPEDTAELHEVCSEVALHIAPLALTQNKTVALEAAAAPVWVRGNAELLRRAVRNLAENALRHAPPGSAVELVVSPDAKVSVLDRGDGVPPSKRDTIFQRFGTQNPHRTGGAGLGLSIVKRIVQVHQGSVTVTSRPGGGSQFTLHLVAASHPPQEDSISRGPRRA